MKKNTIITLAIIFILAIVGIVILNQIRTPKLAIEELERINYQDTFSQETDDYLVYFWQNSCVYCEEVEPEVIDFIQNKETALLLVDMQDANNQSSWYDWESHHEEYDIKIGEVKENGEEQLSEDVLLEDYTEDTDILWEIKVNEDDEIIITHNTPYASTEPATADDIEITGTPTMIQVKNGEFVAYANGLEEVRALLEANK
ncbi:hypothetical protein [Paraliobacillus zengyii]|uniref:hypothetical protein n=1 Tax=Paraliobacillus zengyii TaxID=2213194 RepID=UPI000DD4C351|nr:hypothetical protein [Paraliobacillus zengyii]